MIMPVMSQGKQAAKTCDADCALYLHIPFCKAKCTYCDFYSVAVKDRDPKSLIEMMVSELEMRLTDLGHGIRTLFVGGGTPTILPSAQLAPLLAAVGRATAPISPVEFTVEANPATVESEKADSLVGFGVNRVSMGAQSFVDSELDTLGRRHSPADVQSSMAVLQRSGIERINLDLIFGIPGQTLDTWTTSLRQAVALEPDHISCYGLTFEPGTRLTALLDEGRIGHCDEQLEAEMYLSAVDLLGAAGYRQYETSGFARPACECLHNLIYWRNGPYVGVGPSAAGCVDGRRYKNVSDVDTYVQSMKARGHAEEESETLDRSQIITELIMMQLRLVEGLSIAGFGQRTGIDLIDLLGGVLDRLVGQKFVTVSNTHIALTRPGRLIADAVMLELVHASGNG